MPRLIRRGLKAKFMAKDAIKDSTSTAAAGMMIIPIKPTPSSSKVENNIISEVDNRYAGGSIDRDVVLAHVQQEKQLALVQAWEDSQKARADNKASKKVASIGSWENSREAHLKAQLKKKEEMIENKKAKHAEKMKNKMAEIHRFAAEKRAMIKARKGEDVLKVQEAAAKYRATGNAPKKLFACFSF